MLSVSELILKCFCYTANVSDSVLHIQKSQNEVGAEEINVTFNDVKGVCVIFVFVYSLNL